MVHVSDVAVLVIFSLVGVAIYAARLGNNNPPSLRLRDSLDWAFFVAVVHIALAAAASVLSVFSYRRSSA